MGPMDRCISVDSQQCVVLCMLDHISKFRVRDASLPNPICYDVIFSTSITSFIQAAKMISWAWMDANRQQQHWLETLAPMLDVAVSNFASPRSTMLPSQGFQCLLITLHASISIWPVLQGILLSFAHRCISFLVFVRGGFRGEMPPVSVPPHCATLASDIRRCP